MTAETSPSKNGNVFRDAPLPLAGAFNIFQGVVTATIGIALYGLFVSGGGLSLNSTGQGGLMLVITSLNALALGSVVGLQFKRTWIMILIGIAFAALGIIAVVSPMGVVAGVNTLLIGSSNTITGVLGILVMLTTKRRDTGGPPPEMVPILPLLKRLSRIGLIVAIITIVFGLNMLVPTFLPNILGLVGFVLILPLILIILGLLVLYMTSVGLKLQQMS
jgi:hypothetical protein